MAVALCHREAVVEYFRGLVHEAADRQQLEAMDLTLYYLVQMLSSFARAEDRAGEEVRRDGRPLALRLGEALDSGGGRQRELLREVGDSSLFLTGFFPDRLRRSPVDVDYYAALGGYAYGSLGQRDDDTLAPVFAELAQQFLAFVDVLNEVSERSALASSSDLLRLYERWLQTGSRRTAQRLIEHGVVPHAPGTRRRIQ